MADPRRAVGAAGEDAVAEWYRAPGYAVLDRNWRVREGELDVVVGRAGTIVFCEVKTRRGDAFGAPAEAVTARKHSGCESSGGLARPRTTRRRGLRFDVAAVTSERSGAGTSRCSKPRSEAGRLAAAAPALLDGPTTRVPVPASLGSDRGTTTLCPSPWRISWSHPGQRYGFSASYGCTWRTSSPSSPPSWSVQLCSVLIGAMPPTRRATRRRSTRRRRAGCRCAAGPACGTG